MERLPGFRDFYPEPLPHPDVWSADARQLIFSKWREALGGNICAIASGGAALQPRLARVFWSAKIPVLEGYGLTETSPVIAVNNFQPGCVKFGTVGTVLSNVQVKFAEDGEILCKGPNVMLGYYKEPELTAEVLDKEGWFHTGDIGTFVDGKYLKITDRKKEIFKTSGGKYIAPQMIENKLKESRFIEQAMVLGENQKFAAALIVPAFAFIKEWAERKSSSFATNGDIAQSKEVRSRIAGRVIVGNLDERHAPRPAIVEGEAVDGQHPVLDAVVVVTAVKWLSAGLADRQIAVDMVVEVRVVDSVMRLNRHVFDEQRGDLRAQAVVRVPDEQVADDERMA